MIFCPFPFGLHLTLISFLINNFVYGMSENIEKCES